MIATIPKLGPEYRVAISVTVHSAGIGWFSILHFTSTGDDCCNIGDRVPAILYNSDGFLQINSAVGDNGDEYITYNIELNVEYEIEIVQRRTNGKVRKNR